MSEQSDFYSELDTLHRIIRARDRVIERQDERITELERRLDALTSRPLLSVDSALRCELVGRTPNEKDDAPSMEGKEEDNDEPLQSVEFL